jgi:hypothetical protein
VFGIIADVVWLFLERAEDRWSGTKSCHKVGVSFKLDAANELSPNFLSKDP